jgi:transposase
VVPENGVHNIGGPKRQGLSISAISELTGYDRKTVRKYLLLPDGLPSYAQREPRPGKPDPHKPYLDDRLKAGVWNAQLLLSELRQRGCDGGCTIFKDWLQPQLAAGLAAAVRRFETLPGRQDQVDSGHLGYLKSSGQQRQLFGFTIALGYSRRMWPEAALDRKLGTLLHMRPFAVQSMLTRMAKRNFWFNCQPG